MYKITIIFGVLLSVTGVAGYFQTGAQHVTALIPTFLGVPLIICGILAAKENLRMMAMHIAVLLGLLGFLGSIGTLFKENQAQAALISKGITSALCLVFVILCVRSFIQARKAREALAEETEEN